MNGTLFFRATDATHGSELWKSDGTAPGTVLVKDIVAGAAGSSPQSLVSFGGALWFTLGSDGSIWKSDGTEAGTVLVQPARERKAPGSVRRPALLHVRRHPALRDRRDGTGNGPRAGLQRTVRPLHRGDDSRRPPLLGRPRSRRPRALANGRDARRDLTREDRRSRQRGAASRLRRHRSAERRCSSLNNNAAPAPQIRRNGRRERSRSPRTTFLPNDGVPNWLIDVNGTLLFAARDADHGYGALEERRNARGTVPRQGHRARTGRLRLPDLLRDTFERLLPRVCLGNRLRDLPNRRNRSRDQTRQGHPAGLGEWLLRHAGRPRRWPPLRRERRCAWHGTVVERRDDGRHAPARRPQSRRGLERRPADRRPERRRTSSPPPTARPRRSGRQTARSPARSPSGRFRTQPRVRRSEASSSFLRATRFAVRRSGGRTAPPAAPRSSWGSTLSRGFRPGPSFVSGAASSSSRTTAPTATSPGRPTGLPREPRS